MTPRRTFFVLALAAWLVAAAAWGFAATLGIVGRGSFGLPALLVVIGFFAAVSGASCWAAARFGRPPSAPGAASATDPASAETLADSPAGPPAAPDSVDAPAEATAAGTASAGDDSVPPGAGAPAADDSVPAGERPASAEAR